MRKRIFNRIFLLALCILLLAPSLAPTVSAAADGALTKIRVGLFYGASALASANLANEVGSGYRLGYYDSSAVFREIGTTVQEKLTVCKDENLYLADGVFYETRPSADCRLIGAYHLQVNGAFSSYSEALNAAQNYPDGFPAYINGSYVVRFEFFSSYANALAAGYSDVSVVGESSTCYTVVNTRTGEILFEFDNGGTYFAIEPISWDRPAQTWFKGYQYYGGFQYCRRDGNNLTVINFVDLEDYVSGVIPYEMKASWPLEALKTGAVCARTFACATTKHRSSGFDVCKSTCCQVYNGVYTGENADNVELAAQQTAGICAYYQGEYIEAVYYSSSGGYTESAANTWSKDVGYLQAKEDLFDAAEEHPGDAWSYTVSSAEVTKMLQDLGKNCTSIVGMEVTARTEIGNVLELTFVDQSGRTFTLRKDDVRCLGNIPGVYYMSRCFSITSGAGAGNGSSAGYAVYDGTEMTNSSALYAITEEGTIAVTGGVTVISSTGKQSLNGSGTSTNVGSATGTSTAVWTITGSGNGHNVGLSQYGAYAMAKQGYTYREILSYYYTDIDIY